MRPAHSAGHSGPIVQFGLLLAILAGCQGVPEPPRTLKGDIFEDIPAPKSARVQTDDAASFSYYSESFRCAKYVYRYEGASAEAVAFFESTMTRAPYSWTLEELAELPAGHDRITFRKGEERCVVDIQTKEARARSADTITITIRLNYQ